MEEKIIIETAGFSDLAEVLAVQRLAFYEIARMYRNFRLRPLMVKLEDLEESFDRMIYVKAVYDGDIIGSTRGELCGKCCEIGNVVVRPDYQGRRIGQKMMAEIESRFPQAEEFELFTGKEIISNIRFYEKLGYKIVKEIPAKGTEPDLVIMKKKDF